MKNNDFGIYKITNLANGKMYIGQTSTSFKQRWKEHLYELKNNKHINVHLQNAYNFYGEEFFKFEAIHICDELDDLNKLEVYYIYKFNTLEDGYNLTAGGDGSFGFDEESRKKALKLRKMKLLKNRGIDKNIIIGIKKSLTIPTNKLFKNRCSEIADIFNVSINTVINIRRFYSWREIGEEYNEKIAKTWDINSNERITERAYDMLFNQNKTIKQIAKDLNVKEEKIRYCFISNKIKYSEQNKKNRIQKDIQKIKEYLEKNRDVSISKIKTATGCGRKVIKDFLEEQGYDVSPYKKIQIRDENGDLKEVQVLREKKRFNKEKNCSIKGINYDNRSKRWLVKHRFEGKEYIICTTKDLKEAKIAKEESKSINSIFDLNLLKSKYQKTGNIKKMIDIFDEKNNYINSILGIGEAARKLNLNRKCIEKVLSGKQKTTHGLIFKYSDSETKAI
ncbi:GIY-YIG nuclease family protein [Clostridium perfringens]|nr:GIY-YIG nuclease family protein [Clostridium perfringens]